MMAVKFSSRRRTTDRQNRKGPKTVEGKARSSRNAFRHGLNTINRYNSIFAPEIVEMANAMCGSAEDPLLYEKALLVAESDLMISQARSYRISLIERVIDPNSFPVTMRHVEWKNRCDAVNQGWKLYEEIMAEHPPPGAPSESDRFNRLLTAALWRGNNRDKPTAVLVALPDLLRIARYERRAWSRRRRVFREFMAIMCQRESLDQAASPMTVHPNSSGQPAQ